MASSDPAGRERHKRAWLGVAAGTTGRVASLAATAVSVPLLVEYLGPDQYGIWATVRGFGSYFQITGLGVGYGLAFSIAHATGEGKRNSVGEQVSSAFFSLAVPVLVISAVFTALTLVLPVESLTGAETQADARQAKSLLVLLVWAMALGTLLAVPLAVRAGYQQEYVSNAWAIAGTVGTLLAIVIGTSAGWSSEALGAAVFFAVPAAMAPNLVLLLKAHPESLPRPVSFRWRRAAGLFRQGLALTASQVIAAVMWSTDNTVIATTLGPAAVVPYSIVFTLVYVGVGAIHGITTSYGAAIRASYAAGDWEWLAKTHHRLTVAVLLLGALSGLMTVLWGRALIRLWVGEEVSGQVPTSLLVTLGIYLPLLVWNSLWAFPLTAIGRFRWLLAIGGTEAALNLGLSIWLVRVFDITGVALGTLIPAAAISSWAFCLLLIRVSDGRLKPRYLEVARVVVPPLAAAAGVGAVLRILLGGQSPMVTVVVGGAVTVLAFALISVWSLGARAAVLRSVAHPGLAVRGALGRLRSAS